MFKLFLTDVSSNADVLYFVRSANHTLYTFVLLVLFVVFISFGVDVTVFFN